MVETSRSIAEHTVEYLEYTSGCILVVGVDSVLGISAALGSDADCHGGDCGAVGQSLAVGDRSRETAAAHAGRLSYASACCWFCSNAGDCGHYDRKHRVDRQADACGVFVFAASSHYWRVCRLGRYHFFGAAGNFRGKSWRIQALINNFQPPKQNNANAVVILAQPKIQAPAVVAMAEVKPAAAETKAEPAEAKPVTRHAADTASNHDSKSPPAWIDQPPHREGDSYFVVVKLDADTSLTERDEWLDQRMLVAARDYIDERLFPGEDVSKIVKISAKNLYDNCLREIYPASGLTEAGKEVYARLEFDRRFREEVEGLYRGTLEGRSGTATGGGRFNWHGGARGSLHLLENDVQRPAGGR